jgi:hypothetical protein
LLNQRWLFQIFSYAVAVGREKGKQFEDENGNKVFVHGDQVAIFTPRDTPVAKLRNQTKQNTLFRIGRKNGNLFKEIISKC